jgi:signal transduction histidine kinase
MQGEAVEHLHVEIEELRASRARLVAAADAERRTLERKLHDGVQQELVALVVNLQLARGLCATDPSAAAVLLEETGRDARLALEGLRRLALEIYPPLLEAGGLVVTLRSAAAEAGVMTHVEAAVLPPERPDLAAAVYFCCREALRNVGQHAGDGVKARVSIRLEQAAIVFEIADDGGGFLNGQKPQGGLRRISDRVNALGGRLEIESAPSRGTRVWGSLPLDDANPLITSRLPPDRGSPP